MFSRLHIYVKRHLYCSSVVSVEKCSCSRHWSSSPSSYWSSIRRLVPVQEFSACKEQGWLRTIVFVRATFKILWPNTFTIKNIVNVITVFVKWQTKLCWRALAIFHNQKCCSCFPQCFFLNAICIVNWLWMKSKMNFLWRNWSHFHFLPSSKALSNFVNTARFDAMKKRFHGRYCPNPLWIS